LPDINITKHFLEYANFYTFGGFWIGLISLIIGIFTLLAVKSIKTFKKDKEIFKTINHHFERTINSIKISKNYLTDEENKSILTLLDNLQSKKLIKNRSQEANIEKEIRTLLKEKSLNIDIDFLITELELLYELIKVENNE